MQAWPNQARDRGNESGRDGSIFSPQAWRRFTSDSGGNRRSCRKPQRLGSDVEADLQAVGDTMRAIEKECGRSSVADLAHRVLEQAEPALKMGRLKRETLMRDM